jgi:FMN reductase
MTTRKIAVLAAGLSQPSSTRLLADRLADATTRQLQGMGVDAEVSIVELRDTAQDVVNNLLTGFASPRLERVIDTVTNADALIAVTPIFTTSYSGLFKSFIDVLDPQSLADMPVLIAATGGTERHSLALDYAMRPLFTYLHAVVAPTSVYAASSDWGSAGESGSGALPDRIERAARELAMLALESDRSSRVVDPFALPAGFSPVGGYGAQ